MSVPPVAQSKSEAVVSPHPTPTDTEHNKTVTISEASDLTVRCVEYSTRQSSALSNTAFAPEMRGKVKCITDLEVRRETIAAISPYFRTLVAKDRFAEAGKQLVEIKEVNNLAAEIIFRFFHRVERRWTFKLPIQTVFDVIILCDMWGIPCQDMGLWFADWLKGHKKEHLDSSNSSTHGFAFATKELAYHEVGEIKENNPLTELQFRLPPRILQQLNAARGHLRIELDRELEGPVDTLLTKADCNCKEKTYFAYQKALRLLGAWRPQYGPLTTSVMQHVNALAGFPKVFKELVKDHTLCSRFCRNGYENIVKQACDATLDYFDGLCLDCLDRADPVQDQEDGDEDVKATASAHCRIPHDQPTEHFSSYARKFGRSLRAVDGNRTASHNEPRDKPLFAQLRRLGINDRDMPGV